MVSPVATHILYGYVKNDPVNAVDPNGLRNWVKTAVGSVNFARGGLIFLSSATDLLLAVTTFGLPTGSLLEGREVSKAVYGFVIKGPGLMKRGIRQADEAGRPDDCGNWQNLLGLLPGGHLIDDPGETAYTARDHIHGKAKSIRDKLRENPGEAIREAIEFLQELAF